jgi:hypothetical protein
VVAFSRPVSRESNDPSNRRRLADSPDIRSDLDSPPKATPKAPELGVRLHEGTIWTDDAVRCEVTPEIILQ